MPKFRIKSPDGRTYNVNAPEGTTQAQAVAYVRKQAANKPMGTREAIGNFLGDTVDNIFPNWADEIDGAGEYLKAKVGITNKNPDTVFAETQAKFKGDQARYDKQYPKAAWASTIAGTGIGIAAPVTKVSAAPRITNAVARVLPKAAPKVVRAAQASAVGAGYGTIAGAGQQEGDGRGVNAATGAAIGATVGAAIPSALDAAQATGRFARNYVPGADAAITAVGNAGRRIVGLPQVPPTARPHATADRMLNESMREGNIVQGMGHSGPAATPNAIADEVQNRAAQGVPAMPADVTESMRATTSWASRGKGPGQSAVREALNRRKANEGERVRQHVVDTMGPAVDPIAAVQNNLAASKAAAKPLYDEAYELPTQITPEMANIMQRPAFNKAVPQAIENILNDGGNPRTMGFIPQPDGSFISPAEGVLTTEGFDQVQRVMSKAARDAGDVNPITQQVTHNSNSGPIVGAASGLQRSLRDQNAPLDQAISGYADEAGHRQAIEAGGGIARRTGHEVNDLGRQLPVDAHPSFMQGARTALADQASEFGAKFPNGDTAMAINKSLGSPDKRAAIEAMDGNRGNVQNLQSRLEAEHQGNIVHKEVLGGSQTQPKAALDGEMNEAVSKLSSLSTVGMVRDALNVLGDKAATRYRNEVKSRIAQVVTETNPATVRELMAEIAARVQKDAEFADLMTKSGLIGANLYGRAIKPDEEAE